MSEANTDDVQTGERIMRSPTTGIWYRVTKWRDLGDGKVQAIVKEKLDPDEVEEAVQEAEDDER